MDGLISRREFSSELAVAPRPVALIAAEEVERINATLSRFAESGVRVPEDSRLHQARAVLESVASGAGIAPAQRGDDLGLRALEAALDYHTIARSVSASTPATARRELRDSLVGPLSPPSGQFGPLQLQSQAVAFGAFALAGCDPRHPAKTTSKSPDILLDRGSMTYAVEAKRPQARHNISSHCIAAYEQLVASGCTGGVLVDVSDCVRGLATDSVHTFVEDAGLELLHLVATENGRKPEFRNLIVVGCYARMQAVFAETETEAIFDLITSARVVVLADVRNTLQDHRARWIRRSHEYGMKSILEPLVGARRRAAS